MSAVNRQTQSCVEHTTAAPHNQVLCNLRYYLYDNTILGRLFQIKTKYKIQPETKVTKHHPRILLSYSGIYEEHAIDQDGL